MTFAAVFSGGASGPGPGTARRWASIGWRSVDHLASNIPFGPGLANVLLISWLPAMCFFTAALLPSFGFARPYGPDEFTEDKVLDGLERRLKAKTVELVDSCRPAEAMPCSRTGLDRFRQRLRDRAEGDERPIKILQLGDSHIASDFISSSVRARLQARFGDGGRGLTHAHQRWGYGGRRLRIKQAAWDRTRVVDGRGPGKPYGLFGHRLRAKERRARVSYRVLDEDRRVEVFYRGGRGRPGFSAWLDGRKLADFMGGEVDETLVETLVLPPRPQGKSGPGRLTLVARGRNAELYGLGFYGDEPGLLWSSIGPVGADAKVYLQLQRQSFVKNLQLHDPDLVVLMVGGNDALKVRKRWRSLKMVEKDHAELVSVLQAAVPSADILILAPMDAGRRRGRRILSKPLLAEVRDLQANLSQKRGLGFWDTYRAMGGKGAIRIWAKAGVMSSDLVHPRKPAADLLGRLLAEAMIRWYDQPPQL